MTHNHGSQDESFDRIWRNARLATLTENQEGLGIVEPGAIAVCSGRIAYAGPDDDLPTSRSSPALTVDCEGRWITPGLIDCHTHLIHAGNRAHEFEMRLAGATYEEIARAGGGIATSVKALRAATEDELVRQAMPRLQALISEGTSVVEIKSGYGLDLESERKLLRAARRLGAECPVTIRTTYLGAHAVPPEARGDKTAYIARVVGEILPTLAAEGLVDAVDGYCDSIAFSPEQIAKVFEAAKGLGLPVKLHADQLSNLQGALLAARYGALSADHLEHTDEAGVAALARAGTVAVVLPGAFYFLREKKAPPIALLRQFGVRLALATDSNPGTSPLTSLLLAMNMAAMLFRMTIDECIAGVTREAARALGMIDEVGTLERGKWANLAIWDIERPAELVYRLGLNRLNARVWRGECAQRC
jgi:imidazolonepropionase